jgi:hypothetical protein
MCKRVLLIITFAITAFAITSFHADDSFARNVQVGIKGNNWSVGRIQGICQKQGGDFYQKGDNYGCSKECTGGTCYVSCTGDSKGGQCTGSVPIPRLVPGSGKYHVPVRPKGILAGPR